MAIKYDVEQFVKEYTEAAAAGLSTKELAALIGITQSSLWSRVDRCRRFGIDLPVLRGGHKLPPATRAAKKAKYRRTRTRKLRKAGAVSATPKPQPAASLPHPDIEALSERVADKVYDRLRETLRFQFFVGPEIPA
jgi:biotin operon repressor